MVDSYAQLLLNNHILLLNLYEHGQPFQPILTHNSSALSNSDRVFQLGH